MEWGVGNSDRLSKMNTAFLSRLPSGQRYRWSTYCIWISLFHQRDSKIPRFHHFQVCVFVFLIANKTSVIDSCRSLGKKPKVPTINPDSAIVFTLKSTTGNPSRPAGVGQSGTSFTVTIRAGTGRPSQRLLNYMQPIYTPFKVKKSFWPSWIPAILHMLNKKTRSFSPSGASTLTCCPVTRKMEPFPVNHLSVNVVQN